MELEKFIEETLIGIRNGVINANNKITKNGGSGSKHFSMSQLTNDKPNTIIFDIAVTASNQSNEKGSAGVVVFGVGIGGELTGTEKNEHVSRIKFSVSPAFTIQ